MRYKWHGSTQMESDPIHLPIYFVNFHKDVQQILTGYYRF